MRRMVKESDLDQIQELQDNIEELRENIEELRKVINTTNCYRLSFDIPASKTTNRFCSIDMHQEFLYYTNTEIDSIDTLKADFIEKGFTIEHPLNPHITLYVPGYSYTHVYMIKGICVDNNEFKYLYALEPADTITYDIGHEPSVETIPLTYSKVF